MKNSLVIEYEVKDDGRLYLDFKTKSGQRIKYPELLSVMVSSLSMVIRMSGENGFKTEGQVYGEVINHLEKEFINPDSFKDLEIKR